MSNNLKFEQFSRIFEDFYTNSSNPHRGDHVMRVLKNAQRIAKTEQNVDDDVLFASCILHDVCRGTEIKDHAIEGSLLTYNMLRNSEVITSEQLEKICDSIAAHRFSRGKVAKYIEGKILQDADRLDSIGPVGIVRTLQFSLDNKRPIFDQNIPPAEVYNKDTPKTTAINHIIEKQMKIQIDTFNTVEAQLIAKRHVFLTKEFVELYVESMTI